MSSDFLFLFFQCVFVLLLLALAMAGVDVYFNLHGVIDFFSVFRMNIIFTLLGGFIMLLVFLIMLGYETTVLKIFRKDSQVVLFGLSVSCIIMYFVKRYLMTRYSVIFNFPNIIVLSELLSMMIIPLLVSRFLTKFGKAFAH